MLFYYLRFIVKTIFHVGYNIGVVLLCYVAINGQYPVDPHYNMFVALALVMCTLVLAGINLGRLLNAHDDLVKGREEMPIEQIGRYHYFWYKDGTKISKAFTSYTSAHQEWIAVNQ